MTNTMTPLPELPETAQDAADALAGRYLRTTGLAELDTELCQLWQADAIHGLALDVASTADMLPPHAARLVADLVTETGRLYELLAGIEAAYETLAQIVSAAPLLANGLPECEL